MSKPAAVRNLRDKEENLLRHLFSRTFAGREELMHQLEESEVRGLDENGSLAFVSTAGPDAPVERRIPVEGRAVDVDGMAIHILLHVVSGRIAELELFREDGDRVTRFPHAEEVDVVVFD